MKKPQRHFLSYTIEHVLGVCFVIFTAVIVGNVVSAENGSVAAGAYDLIPPSSPILSLGEVKPGEIPLSWEGASDNVGVVGYKLYRNGSFYVTTSNRSFTDYTNITPGSSYTYSVFALDAAGNASPESNKLVVVPPQDLTGGGVGTSTSTEVAGTADTIPPTQPVVHVVSVSSSGVSLYFYGSSDNVAVSGYRVFRNGSILIGTTENKTFLDTHDIVPGATYQYSVKAFDAAGNESVPSLVVSTTTPNLPNNSTSTSTQTALPSTDTSSASLVMFSASVRQSTETKCILNKPKTSVSFSLSVADSGKFELTSPLSTYPDIILLGSYLLSNGHYSWRVIPNANYAVTGDNHGVFDLNRECIPEASSNLDRTTTAQATTTQIAPEKSTALSSPTTEPINKKPVLVISINQRISNLDNQEYSNEELELRVATQPAVKVNYYILRLNTPVPQRIGTGVRDTLQSSPKGEVWKFVWKTKEVPIGPYKIFARVLFTSDTVGETDPIGVRIARNGLPVVRESPVVEKSGSVSSSTDVPAIKREVILLSQIKDSSDCTNPQECKAYCESTSALQETCGAYIQKRIIRTMGTTTQQHSAENSGSEVSAPVIVLNEKEVREVFAQRSGARVFLDSDSDGISDYDEVNIYQTDPNVWDTDHDGISDGAEILARTNPLSVVPEEHFSSSEERSTSTASREEDAIRLEDPRESGVERTDVLVVSDIKSNDSEISSSSESPASKLTFTGKGLPNSIVTLFIYSDPIIVSVKTGTDGSWVYTLDKELADGSHKVVSTMTDTNGRILAKSAPIPFVKTAFAVTVGEEVPVAASNEAPGFFTGSSLYMLILIVIGLIGIAILILGLVSRRKGKENDDAPLFPPAGPPLPPSS